MLANVYLHHIDLKMEELIKEGKQIWKNNPEYGKAWSKNQHHQLGTDSLINLNPKPRIEYIRYADDFIIGVKDEYDQAEKIKNHIVQWLEQDLKLTINKNKSKIVKASKETKFLSYMAKVNPPPIKLVQGNPQRIPSTEKFKSRFPKRKPKNTDMNIIG
ncbi:reverse transcriptase domain-containing protein [Candidatus Phytoplasma gossypii]|uniref:Reverse transcriptase domain-containing protein n=1 Tax=Candidatus Phytoplasma gossypii TaxID=2982629 RepID=A0ABT9D228_9MOLU|nr:reverse transcriptase domain-containing protein ['Gossypium sp.' phytoplasma]MDO8057350.1 reverse transcriptase domain-containing protein ['Gossypium sp.' phytoplasma]